MAHRFYKYKERTFKQSKADSLVLADSLGREIRYIYHTDTLFFPGCTINALTHKISSGEVNILKYKYITLLIGTNDLAPKFVWKHYKKHIKEGKTGLNLPIHSPNPIPVIIGAYANLIKVIQSLNPNCILFSLAILPRPYDHHRNKGHHVQVNKQLSTVCTRRNVVFVKTSNAFITFGYPKSELFSDGLHLSKKGNRKLNSLISNNVNRFRSKENKPKSRKRHQ